MSLIKKYNDLRFNVERVKAFSLLDIGMFSYRHFVLEMIIAQDVVIKNLSEEQERTLFLLTLEHTKIERNYPDIFSGIHIVPTALLYAKKVIIDNQSAGMENALSKFIKAPSFVGKDEINYLNEYINVKYK